MASPSDAKVLLNIEHFSMHCVCDGEEGNTATNANSDDVIRIGDAEFCPVKGRFHE